MARYLAIDYGRRRIGLAVGDSSAAVVSPIRVVSATGKVDEDALAVQAAGEEYGVDEFVVGLPLNMDGTEGPQAKICRRFGAELAGRSSKQVHFFDERLSSFAAKQLLSDVDLTRGQKKARVDSLAAQGILQSFLESLGSARGGPGPSTRSQPPHG